MEQLTAWVFTELEKKDSLFGVPRSAIFAPNEADRFKLVKYGARLDTPASMYLVLAGISESMPHLPCAKDSKSQSWDDANRQNKVAVELGVEVDVATDEVHVPSVVVGIVLGSRPIVEGLHPDERVLRYPLPVITSVRNRRT